MTLTTKGAIAAPALSARERELLTMLTYRRPAGSGTEKRFIKLFIKPLGAVADGFGNYWLTVGSGSPVLFSSHTDTVHRKEGMQHVVYGDHVATVDTAMSNCLGADCTTGVWIMRQMILAQVPGTYVFHRDEEAGGRGSDWIAKHAAARLAGIKYAIAFDRKGRNEIITHQFGMRGASDDFANSLARILGADMNYWPSDNGTFTDTANYTSIVPECCNLSVGYFDMHTSRESQDVRHACRLVDALIAADWSGLVCKRDPSVAGFDDDWWTRDVWRRSANDTGPYSNSSVEPYVYDRRDEPGRDILRDYVRRYPNDVADFLTVLGFSVDDIEQALYYGADRPGENH